MIRFLEDLRQNGVTSKIVQEIHDYYTSRLEAKRLKHERYKGTDEGVPIFQRTYEHEPITDAQVGNDFFGEIVDVKVGYFAGKAASYGYDNTREEYDKATELLTRFQVVNTLAYIDSETTKDAAICGRAYRLLYVNPDKEVKVTVIKPYEMVVFYEHEPTEIEYAFRIYKEDDDMPIRIDVYDKYNMYVFNQIDGNFSVVEERLHLFDYCPVILYQNNTEEQGDADKVLPIIDSYDILTSDSVAEVSAFRLAYLVSLGAEVTDDEVTAAKRTGAFSLPEGTDMKFITKNINNAMIENLLDRMETNIYQFSKTPNMRDKSFSQNSSGVSLRYKLSGIESKCLTFERKKIPSDIRMFTVLSTLWKKQEGVNFDAYSVIIQHNRNVPIDLSENADAVSKYAGILPTEILLSLMPFIDDPQYVMDLIEKEKDDIEPLEVGDDNEDIPGTVPGEVEEVAE